MFISGFLFKATGLQAFERRIFAGHKVLPSVCYSVRTGTSEVHANSVTQANVEEPHRY